MELSDRTLDALIASRKDTMERRKKDTLNPYVYYNMQGYDMGYIQALEFIKELKNKEEL